MKAKTISNVFLIMLSVVSLQAQNTIDIKNYNQYTNVRLKLSLQDADSDEPIAYATVYPATIFLRVFTAQIIILLLG